MLYQQSNLNKAQITDIKPVPTDNSCARSYIPSAVQHQRDGEEEGVSPLLSSAAAIALLSCCRDAAAADSGDRGYGGPVQAITGSTPCRTALHSPLRVCRIFGLSMAATGCPHTSVYMLESPWRLI